MKRAVTVILFLACCVGVSLAQGQGKTCSSTADCKPDECCLNHVRPVGKRALSSSTMSCEKRGTLGAGCLMRYTTCQPTMVYFQCPCDDGLTCVGNGHYDIPLGEMGNCTPKQR